MISLFQLLKKCFFVQHTIKNITKKCYFVQLTHLCRTKILSYRTKPENGSFRALSCRMVVLNKIGFVDLIIAFNAFEFNTGLN